MKKKLNPGTLLTPLPAVIVTCGDMENSNAVTVAWTGIINSNPPMLYISLRPERYSFDIIKKTKMETKVILTMLMRMEIKGIIKKLPGNLYAIDR